MTTSTTTSATFGRALRGLYIARFAFAFIWAGLLLVAADTSGPLLTVLLVAYPLFDAAAVLWQLRGSEKPKATEWINVTVSALVAIALGVASTMSIAAVLTVWGVWAIGSGIPQLVTAIGNRRTGGQVPQMLSGGLSVLAGGSFLVQGLQGADGIGSVGGYAAVGGVFFLISAIRLSVTLRRGAALSTTR